MPYFFAKDPVFSQTTKSGFCQQVFVMYHATKDVENVESILKTGFRRSDGPNKILGDGLYVSKDIEKTLPYGDVCFKLLVYPGKTYVVEKMSDPDITSWQKDYSSGWIPAGTQAAKHPRTHGVTQDQEETCIKSTTQVRILGIAYGHDLLDRSTRSLVRDRFGSGDHLDTEELGVLDIMVEELGIMYSSFVHEGSSMFLEVGREGSVRIEDWTGRDNQLWTRSWDNCLENKKTGQVLSFDGSQLRMKDVDGAGNMDQKWKRDGKGRMVHKGSGRLLAAHRDGRLLVKTFEEADREVWRFRCMDLVCRNTDTFLHYTPWQNMISWG